MLSLLTLACCRLSSLLLASSPQRYLTSLIALCSNIPECEIYDYGGNQVDRKSLAALHPFFVPNVVEAPVDFSVRTSPYDDRWTSGCSSDDEWEHILYFHGMLYLFILCMYLLFVLLSYYLCVVLFAVNTIFYYLLYLNCIYLCMYACVYARDFSSMNVYWNSIHTARYQTHFQLIVQYTMAGLYLWVTYMRIYSW